jgi:hypothetical protein
MLHAPAASLWMNTLLPSSSNSTIPSQKCQISPFKATPIIYGAKAQFTPDKDTSPPLSDEGIKRVQGIVGTLLYYANAMDNKILHALSDIGTKQAATTCHTNNKINQLLDYCTIYPNDGITTEPAT